VPHPEGSQVPQGPARAVSDCCYFEGGGCLVLLMEHEAHRCSRTWKPSFKTESILLVENHCSLA